MSNDYFQFRQFVVHQRLCAMKVGTDGTLLGAWATSPGLSEGVRSEVLDIGTGTGLIALLMAQRYPQAQVTGIDIDPLAARQARENVAASPFADRVNIIEGDIRQALTNLPAPSFNAIVCNPPYFDASLPSPDAQRTLARHTASLSYRELMTCASRLLSDDGELSVVIPFDCKAHLEAEAVLAGLSAVRVCAVRTTPTKPPRRFLMAFRKHPAPTVSEELTIGSAAYDELTQPFYLPRKR